MSSIYVVVAGSLLLSMATAASADVQDSVVRIIAGNQVATGFVWQGAQGKKYIATSLHTLAGASRIFYNEVYEDTELVVYKIDKESDLALLLPKKGTIAQPPLALGETGPASSRKYMIHGFPAGVKLVQGDSLEFSVGRHNVPMKDLLPNNVLRELTASGYPQGSLKVLRVSSGITPGHSGAPIVDQSDNTVIGIGAGGLSKKGFRRVNWAVPAKTYLSYLEAQGTPGDVGRLARRTDSKYQFSTPSETTAASMSAGRNKYYKIYVVPLDELLDNLAEEGEAEKYEIVDAQTVREIQEEAEELGYDLSRALIDVYQNTETGAMVFVPAGASISGKDDILIANTQDGRVRMYFQIVATESFQNALWAKDNFMALLDSDLGTNWVIDPQSDQEPSHYPHEGIWDLWVLKHMPQDPDVEPQSEMSLSLEIDYDDQERYGDFLGVAVVGDDLPSFSEHDEMYLHQMDVCAIVSGFVP